MKEETKAPFEDFKSMLLGYLRQETILPVKAIFVWGLLGLLGALFIAIGLIFISVGGLRVLQNETGSIFTGSYSWAPYLISAGGLLVLAFLASKLLRKKRK